MPIFEYVCENCGEVNEVLVKNTKSKSVIVCRNCSGKNLKKMFSTSFISKGQKAACNDCYTANPPCGMGTCGSGGMCPR